MSAELSLLTLIIGAGGTAIILTAIVALYDQIEKRCKGRKP